MEPITAILFVTLPLVGAGTYMLMRKLYTHGPKVSAIVAARERALARMQEKAFAPTQPHAESRFDRLEFAINSGLTVTEDVFNTASAPLSAEQLRTINAIFEGAYTDPIHRPKNSIGASARTKAGVPSSFTAFDELNCVQASTSVEYLDSDYQWPESHTRV